jgi:isopentenyl diphosphate isomerase/L-lactate dehydrogenase-like FMN-dependent dehydrogenase
LWDFCADWVSQKKMANRHIAAPRVVNIHDLRAVAKRVLPKVVFDYIDGGAEGESTMRENRLAFEEVTFRPRSAVAIPPPELRTTVLGTEIAMPVMLGPCGFIRMVHPDGEVGSARAAGKAGVGYILSTMSGYKLEDVATATSGPRWYQLYLVGGRAAAEATLARAQAAGFSTLVITIDTAAPGLRERDVRNGASVLLSGNRMASIPYLPQLLAHPKWLASFLLDGGMLTLPNVVVNGKGPMPLAQAPAALRGSVVTWNDLRWIRNLWPGEVIVKGVMTADDAKRALDEGMAGMIVSNHGGRQLDGVPAALRVLPEIVEAVQGRVDVMVDGGVRRGSDVVKAICLGARAVVIGRAYAYGLGAAGEAGVTRCLGILRADIERTLTLLGCPSIAALNPSYIDRPRAG